MKTEFFRPLSNGVHLTEILRSDAKSFIEHMKCRQIYQNTINIPFPYLASDADWWVDQKEAELLRTSRPVVYAIRNPNHQLIGVCGFDGMIPYEDFRAELGYWLAEDYWGKGLMTEVVKELCTIGFSELGLSKITAHVFAHNLGSQRVLEKCSFQKEGYLRSHFKKDGKLIDGLCFGRLA